MKTCLREPAPFYEGVHANDPNVVIPHDHVDPFVARNSKLISERYGGFISISATGIRVC